LAAFVTSTLDINSEVDVMLCFKKFLLARSRSLRTRSPAAPVALIYLTRDNEMDESRTMMGLAGTILASTTKAASEVMRSMTRFRKG
jgi:hypothetical protein